MLKWILYSVVSLGMGALITCAVTGGRRSDVWRFPTCFYNSFKWNCDRITFFCKGEEI